MAVIKQALISVSDKIGIIEFARGLAGFGVALISTGGTAKLLKDAGLKVADVAGHLSALKNAGIPTIDLVVVNLYPFSETVAKPDCALEDAIEGIDIGGPAMVRSAAKNYQHVAVVTDPADYAPLLREMAS